MYGLEQPEWKTQLFDFAAILELNSGNRMQQFPISFVILTDGSADARLTEIIDSIEVNAIPEYEVLIIGGDTTTIDRNHTIHIPFDESSSSRPWITRKKNIGTARAANEVIVYLHDYHVFDASWYAALVEFGMDWEIQMNQILMINGYRMFDWLTYDHPEAPCHTPIPYHRHDLIPYQYISGGYWIAKRSLMMSEPLNEALGHHQAEDLEWSLRVRNNYRIKMNPDCIVRHNKPHRENELQRERMARLGDFFH